MRAREHVHAKVLLSRAIRISARRSGHPGRKTLPFLKPNTAQKPNIAIALTFQQSPIASQTSAIS
jgi:hypothetical protein